VHYGTVNPEVLLFSDDESFNLGGYGHPFHDINVGVRFAVTSKRIIGPLFLMKP
jgi:hypothetical protein